MMNTFQQQPGSFSLEQEESSENFDQVLALGRKIVKELGLEPSVDTLGRWMAHHIADLMTEVEGASGVARISAEKRCFEAILTLWKHRGEFTNGKRPFEALEPIIRAVESLDPDADAHRYFRYSRPMEEDVDESEAKTWIEMAEGLDYSAKVLIRYCLSEAARNSIDESKEWFQLAKDAGADNGADGIVIRLISRENEIRQDSDPNEEVRRLLKDRINRLEGFSKLSETVLQDLKIRLDSLPQNEQRDKNCA